MGRTQLNQLSLALAVLLTRAEQTVVQDIAFKPFGASQNAALRNHAVRDKE